MTDSAKATAQVASGKHGKLEARIRQARAEKPILLTSHAVLGYPSFELNASTVKQFVDSGVDLIELQFPFSEPVADGPTLLKANLEAVDKGVTVADCFRVSREIIAQNPKAIFLLMTYYNIAFQYGVRRFIEQAKEVGFTGIIVPDLLIENASELREACDDVGVDPVFLVTPKTGNDRLREIAKAARGMVYCVARTGVTGYHTIFSDEFDRYLSRVREATDLPIGVGFGIHTKEDVEHLKGRADIAIVCSQAVKISIEQSPEAAAAYLGGLR